MALCVSDLVTGDLDLADYEVIGSQHLHDDGGALLVACDIWPDAELLSMP